MSHKIIIAFVLLLVVITGTSIFRKKTVNNVYAVGQAIDSINGVKVYYNGAVDHVAGRNLAEDDYNLGLKYQCVEFVKRYYYECLDHKMPNSYGHAKDFYNKNLPDGAINEQRDLTQYSNPGKTKPEVSDLVVFSGTIVNIYGHVAIVSKVGENEIEIIQQNPGAFAKSRVTYPLLKQENGWKINNARIMGWLRKEQ